MRTNIIMPLAMVALLAGCATAGKPVVSDTEKEAAYRAQVQAALAEQDPEKGYAELVMAMPSMDDTAAMITHQTLVARYAFFHLPTKLELSSTKLAGFIISENTYIHDTPATNDARILARTTPTQQVLIALGSLNAKMVTTRIRQTVNRLCLAPKWMGKTDQAAMGYYAARACQAWIQNRKTGADHWIAKIAARIAIDPMAAPTWLDVHLLGEANAAALLFATRLRNETGIDIHDGGL